ncbi:MAG: TolC family protein [Candidatus Melainabacteria bacterium]|jgi:outer membrane protein TolC|nr:TolC family protein [Candidatus Melainabacteria bacterium]
MTCRRVIDWLFNSTHILRASLLPTVFISMLILGAADFHSCFAAEQGTTDTTDLAAPIRDLEMLTLDQAVAIALREQPKILAQRARYDREKTSIERERSRMLPYIQAAGVGNLGPTVINGFNGLFVAASRGNFGFDVNARMTLFDFGANWHRLKASKVDVQRSLQDVQIERAQIILIAKLAYLKVLEALELRKVAEQDVANRTLLARYTKETFETGLKSKLDWQQSEVDLAQAMQALEERKRQVELAYNALNESMGREPGKRYKVVDPSQPAPPVESVSSMLEEGKKFRPCLIAAVKKIEAAKERVTVARREFLPKIDAIGGGGYLDDSAILQGNQNRYGSGAVIAYAPLFTGGKLEADLAAARASAREAKEDHHQMELKIAREIFDAFESLKATYTKYQISEQQVSHAKQTQQYANERYKAGLGFYLEVSAAETLLINALAEQTRNRFDYASVDAVLQYARGKDYLAYKM